MVLCMAARLARQECELLLIGFASAEVDITFVSWQRVGSTVHAGMDRWYVVYHSSLNNTLHAGDHSVHGITISFMIRVVNCHLFVKCRSEMNRKAVKIHLQLHPAVNTFSAGIATCRDGGRHKGTEAQRTRAKHGPVLPPRIRVLRRPLLSAFFSLQHG